MPSTRLAARPGPRAALPALVLLALLAAGCPSGDDDDAGDDDASGDDDTTAPVDGCRATPRAADRDRRVVVGLPYGAANAQADAWAVLTLDRDGTLTDPGTRVTMGRNILGEVVFTPDAEIALVAQDDGTIGALRLPADGEPEVIHARFAGEFYAEQLVMDPSGERVYVVDRGWQEDGGGVYEVAVDCDDGTLGPATLLVGSKLASALLLLDRPPTASLLVADELAGAAAPAEAFVIDWPPGAAPLAALDLFAGDDASVCSAALHPDRALALIGENSAWSGVPNRIAAVRIDGAVTAAVQVIDLLDPIALVASPFGDAALAVSGYGDAVWVLELDPAAAEPIVGAAEPDYLGASPQLPAGATLLDRGPLRGLVLIAENQGVRRMTFDGTAAGAGIGVEDRGLVRLGDGYEAITGAIGVQP